MRDQANSSNPDQLIVYYDGACPLCSIEIAHYKRQKGSEALTFVDASDPTTDLGDDLDRETALGRFHVRDNAGALVSGAKGFTRIWQVLPRWRPLAQLARLPGVTPLLELAYRGFLPLRPYLSRWVAKRTGVSRETS